MNGPKIFSSGAAGEVAAEEEQERPAASVVWSPPLRTAGRKEGAGAPGELGGSAVRAPAFPPNSPSREGGRQ